MAAALLEPTTIYAAALAGAPSGRHPSGLAHVTGGGLAGRGTALAGGHRMFIDRSRFAEPPIFDVIRQAGGVTEAEMAATFNLGLGFLAVVSPGDAGPWLEAPGGWLDVGEIGEGTPGVDFGG